MSRKERGPSAELPRAFLNFAEPPSPAAGQFGIAYVRAGGDLQAALNSAKPGTTIYLDAGATFTGNFVLPKKDGDNWITIRPLFTLTKRLPANRRVTPNDADLLPKLISPNSSPALRTAPGASSYRLIGLELAVTDAVKSNTAVVALGDGSASQNSLSLVPRNLVLDQCYIHGNATGNIRRGIALNSASTVISNCYISECHEVGADSQAICGWNGPGPFKIVNNYLEGSGENVMFGGADPAISGLVPSDIEFRGNTLVKPLSWREGAPSYAGIHWTVKNLFELKNARRVLVSGNTLENSWADAQTGFAFSIKTVNQSGTAPWTVTEDVTITNNLVRHAGGGVNLLGKDAAYPSGLTSRVTISNNLFEDIDHTVWGGNGCFLQVSQVQDLTVSHNTVFQSGNLTVTYGSPSTGYSFINNIVMHGPYGVKGDGTATGNGTLTRYFPSATFRRNVIIQGSQSVYPPDNFFLASLDQLGFSPATACKYQLPDGSLYVKTGTDGLDIGCDTRSLQTATNATGLCPQQ